MAIERVTRDYRILMPHDLRVVASCEDVGCDQWRRGWETLCDESTDLGAMVAMTIRSGQTQRDFAEFPGAPVTVFRFPAGQRCFQEHRTRPGRLLVQRANQDTGARRTIREHTSLADLAEDYTEHIGRLAEQADRG